MIDNLDSLKLDVIYRIMNGETFGLRQSQRIVGGRARLLRLIEEGKVRAEKVNSKAQNGKWQCNASDVLRYARINNLKSRVMENEVITGKHWLIYGVLYPLGVILLAAAVETIGRMIF